jgi:hypothetical protein
MDLEMTFLGMSRFVALTDLKFKFISMASTRDVGFASVRRIGRLERNLGAGRKPFYFPVLCHAVRGVSVTYFFEFEVKEHE